MTSNGNMTRIRTRKFLAIFITLAMMAVQFAALPVYAAPATPGVARVVLQVPDDVTIDSTNGFGKTVGEYNGLVVTMKQGFPLTFNENNVINLPTIDPLLWDENEFQYTFTQAGTYSFYSRGPGYYRVIKLFNVTQAAIDAGETIYLPIPNGPLGEGGYQIGQWQSFADRKADDYTEADKIPQTIVVDGETQNVTVAINSYNYMAVVYPDEIRELFEVTPETFAKQKSLTGNTNELFLTRAQT